MTILELTKDALRAMTDAQLEQLIGRLAEAEVAGHGAHVGDVRFSGSITAPDGGVDVRVDVQKTPFVSKYIPKPNTIFQSKKHSMPAGRITGEMIPNGNLSAVIGLQCDLAGAYVIVSLEDDCTEPTLNTRIQAMVAAVADHPNKDAIRLDFYGRSQLHQWLRQHPSVMLWVRNVLGQPLSGWQSYGRWSNVPNGMPDDLIMAAGVSVVLPTHQHQRLTLEQAITPMRNLIATSDKAIRVAGLSGVGKTRFVQALFDETIGEDALDPTSVVYTDTGADPDPSARQMIDQLIQDGRTATVVVDDCPPALHSDLAGRITSSKNRIKLITVEYDIRDDKPLTTEVVHIEAHGPEIAEALVLRRYPGIGQANARQVAEFSNGNTRIALALADCVEVGESLALLSDANLFERFFQQRNEPDGQLRAHAEALSLSYSFAVEGADGEPDELTVLGSLCEATPDQLYSSAQTLLDRQIAQKRGRWSAILPQAIANRLAKSALDRMRIQTLMATFENPANHRLLKSFAHRLGLMHDHPVAQQIVDAWLAPGGMLVPVTGLDDEKTRILDYVAPVRPDILLDRIEAEIMAPGSSGMEVRHNPRRRTTILNMLVSLAYEAQPFDRCINLLLRIAEQEDPANNHDSVRDKIVQFFQPYLSGTHATMEQRAAILRTSLWSQDPNLRALGTRMLSKTLNGRRWTGMGMGDFGARPRDFGFEPNHEQLITWREMFLGVALEAGLDGDTDLSDRARSVLAQEFRGLWRHAAVRGRLIDAARTLNEQRPWTDGWKAVQSTMCFDYRVKDGNMEATPLPPELAELRDLLAPRELVAKIKTYLFGGIFDLWSLDPDFDHDDTAKYEQAMARLASLVTGFGEQFANSNMSVGQLGPELFSTSGMPYGRAFGAGLAKGSHDIMASWVEMVATLRESGVTNFNCSVLSGFIDEAGRINHGIDRQILDGCLDDPLLRTAIRLLHPSHDFNEACLDRCLRALEHPDVDAWSCGALLWGPEFAALPVGKLLELAEALLHKPNGDNVVLEALGMKLHATDKTIDTLGPDLRRIGLVASTNQLSRDRDGNTTMIDHHMAAIMAACLPREGNGAEKSALLDAIFSSVDARCGWVPGRYDETIQMTAATMPESFLDRVFSGDEAQRRYRTHFLEDGGINGSFLATTDIGRIIDWCRAKDNPVIWESVAKAVDLFVTSGDEKTLTVSDVSKRFVEASPNPDQVLTSYAGRITPSAGSGSRAAVMERHTNALAVFTHNENPEIAASATRVIAEARAWVERVRECERRGDEANEQRFE